MSDDITPDTEVEDTEGHLIRNLKGARPAVDTEDTEGHIRLHQVSPAGESDDVEGHIRTRQ